MGKKAKRKKNTEPRANAGARARASTAASRHVNQAERIDKQYRGSVIDPQRLRLPKLHTVPRIPRLTFYDIRTLHIRRARARRVVLCSAGPPPLFTDVFLNPVRSNVSRVSFSAEILAGGKQKQSSPALSSVPTRYIIPRESCQTCTE